MPLSRILPRFLPRLPLRRLSLLPRSLVGRVFAVFSLTLLLCMGTGLGLFYRYQFLQHIEDTQDTALTLVEVAVQNIEDSAVIGDYDTVKRTLGKMLFQSPFKRAEFIDLAGGTLVLDAPHPARAPAPDWLVALVAGKLYDVNRIASVGGRDYGVVRLRFDERKLAAQLWTIVLETATLAAIVFVASLALMRTLLRRWLVTLARLRTFETDAAAGRVSGTDQDDDAPSEIQEAIDAVNRGAASMRVQFGQRIDSLMNSLMQHKSALDQAAIVCEVDAAGIITGVNDLFVTSSGFAAADVVGRHLAAVGRRTDAGAAWQPSGQVWNGEVAIAGRHGTSEWYRTVVPIFDAAGAVERHICIDIDISKRKEFERTIVDNARRQTLVAELGRKALTANDLDALLRAAADAAAHGLDAAGAALYEMLPTRALAMRAASGIVGDAAGLEQPIVCADRDFGVLAVYVMDERRFSDDEVNFLGGIANILAAAVELDDAKHRLTYLAQYDALTKLPNRRHLAHALEETISEAARHGGRAAVMFIDLDHFKNVNDMLGHGVGDRLLVQAAQRLQACARPGDVVARLGGDEFALVLPELTANADAVLVAQRIIAALAQPFVLQGQQLFVSASVGIASYPDDGGSADLLLKNADTAMYGAKNGGRNNYRLFQAEMHESAARRMQMETQLRQALERGEFLLHYQPKLDLAGGTISGFEALLRWNHPERGLVAPLEFIGILEDTGLILPVGEWVIGEVCRQLTAWDARGLALPPVAINLSARQLQQPDLPGAIERIVAAAGIAPALLEFELTESMLMTDPEAAVAVLSRIKALGMRLSVDDFGTGYSSLAYLKRFPLDALKIDRTFVRDLADDPDDAAITKAVIRLAHSLSLKVVAEGVETVEQIRELERYDCDEIQGYYVSRPLVAEACVALLKDTQPA
jgi:diguanylate cyclase (GGDEF)-like protein